jgi:hypothetical protein
MKVFLLGSLLNRYYKIIHHQSSSRKFVTAVHRIVGLNPKAIGVVLMLTGMLSA